MFGWLGVAGWVGAWKFDANLDSRSKVRIGSWVGERPDLYRALMDLGLEHCTESVEACKKYSFDQLMRQERERRLFHAPLLADFGSWCLDRATVAENRAASAWLIHRVADAVHRSNGRELSRSTVGCAHRGKTIS